MFPKTRRLQKRLVNQNLSEEEKEKSVSMFMGENLPQQEKQRSIEYIKNYFKKRKKTFQ